MNYRLFFVTIFLLSSVKEIQAQKYAKSGLNPELLELLSPKQRCDMPELLTRGLKRNHSVIAFPIHEYWLDVGHHESLAQANGEW